jgi:hypothetical protein
MAHARELVHAPHQGYKIWQTFLAFNLALGVLEPRHLAGVFGKVWRPEKSPARAGAAKTCVLRSVLIGALLPAYPLKGEEQPRRP